MGLVLDFSCHEKLELLIHVVVVLYFPPFFSFMERFRGKALVALFERAFFVYVRDIHSRLCIALSVSYYQKLAL